MVFCIAVWSYTDNYLKKVPLFASHGGSIKTGRLAGVRK